MIAARAAALAPADVPELSAADLTPLPPEPRRTPQVAPAQRRKLG